MISTGVESGETIGEYRSQQRAVTLALGTLQGTVALTELVQLIENTKVESLDETSDALFEAETFDDSSPSSSSPEWPVYIAIHEVLPLLPRDFSLGLASLIVKRQQETPEQIPPRLIIPPNPHKIT